MIMKKKGITLTLAALLSISLIGGILTGCSTKQASASTGTSTENSQQADGGVLTLKVNPEIDISYDDEGLVTKVEGKMMMEIRLLQNMRIIAERIAVR